MHPLKSKTIVFIFMLSKSNDHKIKTEQNLSPTFKT